MRRIDKLLSGIILFFLFSAGAEAQLLDDWQARPSLSLEHQFNKKWSVESTYYQYFDNNISSFDKSVFGVKANHKLNSWLQGGVNYRLGLEKHSNYHDLRYALTFKPDFGLEKWQFSYQPLFQQKLESKQKTENFLRNQLKAEYKLSKKFSLFALTENYLQLNHGFKNHTQKYAFGSEFELSEQSDLEFQFTVKDRIGEKKYARLELNYIYQIGK